MARWRIGLVAYRAGARNLLHSIECWRLGVDAMMEADPDLPLEEARLLMTRAVAWCSSNHRDWLDRGVPRREWVWPPRDGAVGHYRPPGSKIP